MKILSIYSYALIRTIVLVYIMYWGPIGVIAASMMFNNMARHMKVWHGVAHLHLHGILKRERVEALATRLRHRTTPIQYTTLDPESS